MSLHQVDRYLIRKLTDANGLVFSLQNNSLLQKRQTTSFVSKCSTSNILEGAVESKALSARRSWVIVMPSVGETF